MPPLVSIITPLYNSERYLRETCASVLAQTFTDWEWIIVDDGSGDGSLAMAREMAAGDPRILVLANERNQGAAKARNRAIEAASGRYMAFLDSDDLWMPEKLERQLAFMERTGAAFTCTSYEKINEMGSPTGKVVRARKKMNYDDLLLRCPVGNSSVLYDAFKLGKFVIPDIRKRNDYALWLQILKKEQFVYGMPDVLMQYRVRPESLSRNKLSLIRYYWSLYRGLEQLSVLRSAYLIAHLILIKILSYLPGRGSRSLHPCAPSEEVPRSLRVGESEQPTAEGKGP